MAPAAAALVSCPANSFGYNGTLCACDPGYFLTNESCAPFDASAGDWVASSGVGPSPSFLTSVIPLESIRRLTQSQAVLLLATLVALVAWLAFCLALRFCRVDGGRSIWFRLRWWISRLDFFDTNHWLDDQKVVTKRKTELGGTFSVASWILFAGLLSALLYQIITKRSIEVHRVRPANYPDLLSFVNDMEFNITTISSMSCSHLRGLDTVVVGTPGFIDYRLLPLSTYANYYCQNTSRGPTISLKCNNCQIPPRDHYITWQFVDLPNDPAMAVGFQFNLTSKSPGDDKHMSFVGGTLNSESYINDKPKTFRGPDLNVLTIHLFPQIFNHLDNLKIIQPLVHDFIPGSSFSEASDLQASLQSSKNGLVNTTLYISYLSDYIMEIDHENVFGLGARSKSTYVPMSSTSTSVNSKEDPGWKFGFCPDGKDKNKVECKFCGQVSKGGINRFKKHIAGIRGDVAPCLKVPSDVREEILNFINSKKQTKVEKQKELEDLRRSVRIFGDDDDDIVVEVEGSSKKPRTNGPMDKFVAMDPEVIINARGKMKQTTLKDTHKKEERARVCQYVARWMYQAGIALNTASLKSFNVMLEAVGQYGPGFVGPTSYELGEPFLRKEVELTKESLKSHRDAWEKYGCTVMTDGWTDRRGRSIMNLCVNCHLGTSFLRSVDASDYIHDAEYIFLLVDKCIEEVGEKNVIQVVTDSFSSNMAAAKLLKNKRPKVFWTPCAAHRIDLMLEGIGNMQKVKSVITKARALTVFIYSHHITLSMMRRCTGKKDLVRPGVTRFATAFLSLQSILEQKEKLRLMFTSDDWLNCKWSKHIKGQRVAATVLNSQFWKGVVFALKVFLPLVKVLRLVDSDRVPTMGFIYAAMENAKKEIIKSLNNEEALYKPILDIIELKWDKNLNRSLDAAGFYLNPFYYYTELEVERNETIMDGLLQCIETFYQDDENAQDQLTKELGAYRDASGPFGKDMAIRQRNNPEINPVQWWSMYGSKTPLLQEMALKILNLTCSSSGCERNWSTFEMIHTKKRNRLEQKKLNDLVYVQFNARLKERQNDKNRDPICTKNMDDAASWLYDMDPETEEVYPGSGLTWGLVDKASVSFLADMGGLCAISLAIFFYLLVQCEARIKKLRCEDSVMRRIKCQRRAQRNWDKLRRYVTYTWGASNLDVERKSSRRHGGLMTNSCCGIGSLHEMKQPSIEDSIFAPDEMNVVPDAFLAKGAKSSLTGGTTTFDGIFSQPEIKHEMLDIEEEKEEKRQSNISCKGNTSEPQMNLFNATGIDVRNGISDS